jgi:hypothetical protein
VAAARPSLRRAVDTPAAHPVVDRTRVVDRIRPAVGRTHPVADRTHLAAFHPVVDRIRPAVGRIHQVAVPAVLHRAAVPAVDRILRLAPAPVARTQAAPVARTQAAPVARSRAAEAARAGADNRPEDCPSRPEDYRRFLDSTCTRLTRSEPGRGATTTRVLLRPACGPQLGQATTRDSAVRGRWPSAILRAKRRPLASARAPRPRLAAALPSVRARLLTDFQSLRAG